MNVDDDAESPECDVSIATLKEASYSELVGKRRPIQTQEAAEELDSSQ
jgi:hypothetical protein